MNKSYIPEVAKILGVEIGEEFDILVNEMEMLTHGPYKIIDNAIVDYVGCKTKNLLYGLLTGEYTLKKRPWKPKNGDKYWFVSANGRVYDTALCTSNAYELGMINIGNCFPTEETAKAKKEEILTKLEEIKREYTNE